MPEEAVSSLVWLALSRSSSEKLSASRLYCTCGIIMGIGPRTSMHWIGCDAAVSQPAGHLGQHLTSQGTAHQHVSTKSYTPHMQRNTPKPDTLNVSSHFIEWRHLRWLQAGNLLLCVFKW